MTDDDLLARFEDGTLPYEQWNHRAHVKVAYLYLSQQSFDVAANKMRAGIKAYNAIQQVSEGPLQGYNETTTMAFLHLVAATMASYGQIYPTEDADTFCDTHPQLLNKHILRLFYSPERRSHPDAKSEFIAPDLAPLPKHPHE